MIRCDPGTAVDSRRLLRGCPPLGLGLFPSQHRAGATDSRRTEETVQDHRRTTTHRPWRSGLGIAGALLLVLVTAPVGARSEADEGAAKRGEAMANCLAQTPRLSVTADSSYGVVQESGQKIGFGELRAIPLRRPDRARIEATRRDGVRRGLIFDGKQIAAFDLDQKVYAT